VDRAELRHDNRPVQLKNLESNIGGGERCFFATSIIRTWNGDFQKARANQIILVSKSPFVQAKTKERKENTSCWIKGNHYFQKKTREKRN